MYIGAIGKGDNFNKIAARSLQEHQETLKATVGQLTDELVTLNHRLATPTTLQEGQCIVLLREWAHPNVGDAGRALQVVREPSGQSIKNDLIATVYAEQSGSKIDDADIQNSLNEQREYILYSILRRVEGLEWSSSTAIVLDPAQYHGKQEGNEAYIYHYKPAIEYLNSEPPSKPVKSTEIEQIETLVETLQSTRSRTTPARTISTGALKRHRRKECISKYSDRVPARTLQRKKLRTSMPRMWWVPR